MKMNWQRKLILIPLFLLIMIISCHNKVTHPDAKISAGSPKSLELMGFTIQAGAFTRVENAVKLTQVLKSRGLEATYFAAADGFFKVRFGNFTAKEIAGVRAQSLKDAGVIEEFYIVRPEDYAAFGQAKYGTNYLRESLVRTAHDFIGVPYLWGGASSDAGFDCSGLTMTVYQLNGLNLPRQSIKQYDAGNNVERKNLQKGDLVFFAVNEKDKVSHVGVYIGEGKFIHAPSQGKKIRVDSLSSSYFARKFIGGKSYL